MKLSTTTFLTTGLILISFTLFAQNKKTTYYDSLENITTWEAYYGQVFEGRYTPSYDKQKNEGRLIRTSEEEYQEQLKITKEGITTTKRVGEICPDFEVEDIEGNRYSKEELKGKIIVLNFWFIGCASCEMELSALNKLRSLYSDNPDVIFLSFAKNDKEKLKDFLPSHPINYQVIPTEKKYIKKNFVLNAFPTHIIVDEKGVISYCAVGTGIGILDILKSEIESIQNRNQ
ncbi:TlpA disulfide reductase family protein [Bernardetia sp. ABR2-2B]|uniref:TlpA family protein disulfide reductase n=1 Tax=Bernardetia sp. ABR2-2B TaxID=3127472 RepID=UPI0030D1C490